ncbi:bifunctional diaminohydroxyphosphoribosylaminopyrimidine deaminase/5-amino-6-(5-phosphoribosylamino)uracil reductase RibD [Nakamurella antarctica]|uniref:Riboflavin biosynthesis protein RibD n=1 Tax=Nakamurella antarctica TaxID=1902245 RepID=A0A3G8ZIH3_9ACTN|nr:bifunctional diaminohydroxyphosphoribosylaminopyrimidine deaminase/5-amino-6-(5-phosphoribosylamino)uracil reductase RibD [Nakamurella antarctica]AZI57169.1 bifunctional diaminohydroxyphosphoribosylaminopyrimidine deaminase/5-amino-6-(5-phosphoribosylamino)uracil reductase RibD [Nakamurella antarctica]
MSSGQIRTGNISTASPAAAASATEIAAMSRAVELAARGAGTVLPNPVVGCVLLDQHGAVIGEGWHQQAGGAHAEVNALNQAGERARGATAVVTLEPCNHQGRTGPCSLALINAGVARVVIAVLDPNPAAVGGVATLQKAGVEVVTGVQEKEASDVNRVWLGVLATQRPYVSFKAGTTVDGRVAAVDGTSKWITSPASRGDVHRLRSEVDTMLVGVGTVLADDPMLTVRHPDGSLAMRQPLRVIADSLGQTPASAKILGDEAPTWVATTADVGAGSDGRLSLPLLMAKLYGFGRRHVLLEGGPRLAAAMLDAGLMDEIIFYIAPLALGAGKNAIDGGSVNTLAQGHRLELRDVTTFDADVRLRYTVRRD